MPIFQAYSNYRNSIDMVDESKISGANSTHAQLISPNWVNPIVYQSGYSSALPFPDQSENPDNGPMSFDGNDSRLEFRAKSGSSRAGLYGYAKEQEYFSDGHLVSRNQL